MDWMRQHYLMDIDNSSFDAKRYVLGMLKQNSIKELMRRNNEIDEEIKTHDHEIQSLVFENYSKFISSIDTVRDMKDNICAVDDKLKVLERSMDKISELALKIDSTFSVKRKEIQKLDTINKDLEKLKNLCEFPNILQQDIKFYKSISETKLPSEVDGLFAKSITSYEACYKTLVTLKDEPLIAPIYKESIDKVETMRSTLKALQAQFNKNKLHSNILRNITKKLLIITDDQVSVLRIYLHSWKERFGEACFKSEKKSNLGLVVAENGKKLLTEVSNSQIPEINEELWKQFEIEFCFIYEEIYPKLTLSNEQIQLHITNYTKQIFGWALNHYTDAVPLYCTSLKTYVHVHHFISNIIKQALQKVAGAFKEDSKERAKVYQDLKEKMEEKFQALGVTMLNFVFGRMKLYFVLEVVEGKTNSHLIAITEESLKESYIKILNPLKDNISSNFKIFIDDMEHFKTASTLVFKSQQKYEQIIHKQIESLLRFLAVATSKPSYLISEQLCGLINPAYSMKLNKNQKGLIESTVKELVDTEQSGCWFVVAHHFLSSLHNNLGKKIIEHTQKNVEIPKNHNYVNIFTFIKTCISKNLISVADKFCISLRSKVKFEQIILLIQDFVDVLNIIFIDTKRNMMKKPSFLKDCASIHQTEVLAIKKLHLIEKRQPSDRNSILLYFIRKLLKEVLYKLRQSRFTERDAGYSNIDIYCLVQICYELINVEEESQIVAFYSLITQNTNGEKPNQDEADEKYGQARKLLRAAVSK